MDFLNHALDTLLGRAHANVRAARLRPVQPTKRVSQEIEGLLRNLADSRFLLIDSELQLTHDLAQFLQSLFSLTCPAQNHQVIRIGHQFSQGLGQPKLPPCQHKPAHVNVCQQW